MTDARTTNTDDDRRLTDTLPTVFAHDERGVALTIDAILTSILLIAAIAVTASQMPANPGQEAQDATAQDQFRQDASDTLATARDTGNLEDAILYWDDPEAEWIDAGSSGTYVNPPAGHPLETPLVSFYSQRGNSYNINVIYQRSDGTSGTEQMYYQGTPGPNAIVVSQTVIIEDTDELPSGTDVEDATAFYAPDAFPDNDRYNIMRVQIVMWE